MATMTHDTAVRGRLRNGLIVAVVSASSFGLSGALARGLMNAGWSPAAVVSVRVLVGAAVLLPFALVQLRGEWNVLRRNASLILAYGIVPVAGTQLAYFNAVAHLQVGVALLVEYTAPIAVVGWMWLRHRQRPGAATIAGGLVGLIGLVLVLDLSSGVSTNGVGMLWALAAMVGAAAYFVLSAKGEGAIPGTVLAAGGLLVGGLTLLVAGAIGIVPMRATANPVAFEGFTTHWWAVVLLLGTVTAALAYASGIIAARLLGSRMASFAALTEVLAAVLFAWALLGEAPHLIQLLGGALILIGVVAVRLGEPETAAHGES
ncbi:EamA family transporter [Nocardia sp. 2]|uniref:EamA family transporter n=1 Tax=Nocardia acididurans TaxID=2802282 RepID=A0ABS1M6B1_9NOCA|nr:EamA family transporter [Nocardia acididurans]MBL1075600.1 EamA family transporter [Nocardia acididurans]